MKRKLCFDIVILAGMDTQLVVRPLLDKVEKNTQESALRKIAFPHVSTQTAQQNLSQLIRVEENCLENHFLCISHYANWQPL